MEDGLGKAAESLNERGRKQAREQLRDQRNKLAEDILLTAVGRDGIMLQDEPHELAVWATRLANEMIARRSAMLLGEGDMK